MIQAYRELVNKFDIELLLLVYYFINDWLKENELLLYVIMPSSSDDKCIWGMPIIEQVPDH